MLQFAVFWGFYFLIVGFAEEFYLRGYTQFTLTEGIGFWPAALLFRPLLPFCTGTIPEKPWPAWRALASSDYFSA